MGRRHTPSAPLGLSAQASMKKWEDRESSCLCPWMLLRGTPHGAARSAPGSQWVWVGQSLRCYSKAMISFLRVCLFSDKKSHMCPHTPANLQFDFYNLILEKGQQRERAYGLPFWVKQPPCSPCGYACMCVGAEFINTLEGRAINLPLISLPGFCGTYVPSTFSKHITGGSP